MKHIDPKEVISELGLHPMGGRGWHTSKDFECPECNKGDEKFGLLIKENGGLVHCWRCGHSDSIYNFLFKVNKYGLVHNSKKYEYIDELENVLTLRGRDSTSSLPEEQLPIGFKRIEYDEYLESRGITLDQYNQFGIGITNSPMEPAWNNKIIFQIFNKGVRVGYLGRSKKSKEWHDKNMENHRENGGRLVLRYKNSDGDFSQMLGGLDDITNKTEIVIIVEGLMDKANLDRLLDTYNDEIIQVVYTFGSSISLDQISLLKGCKSVNQVIILFDDDAIKKVFGFVAILQSEFNQVFVGVTNENDPGDMEINELSEILNNVRTPDEFYSGAITIKNLRYED